MFFHCTLSCNKTFRVKIRRLIQMYQSKIFYLAVSYITECWEEKYIPEDIVARHKVFPFSLSSWPIIQKDNNKTLHSSNLQSHKNIFLRTDFDYVIKLVPQEAVTTTQKKKKKSVKVLV